MLKSEFIQQLKTNREGLFDLKKAQIKHSQGIAVKHSTETLKGINIKDDEVVAVINTTNYMDSHSDVHIPGIWTKSIQEQQGKIYYIADHTLEVNKVIAFPKDVAISTVEMKWSDLGAKLEGTTEALIFTVKKDDIRLQAAKEIIDQKIDIEHSVRMRYIKYYAAVDSDDEEMAMYKEVWDKYIDQIANKDEAIKQGYFWAVTEAGIYKEGSMVLAGSNDITPLLQKTDIEAAASTSTTEPDESTQKQKSEAEGVSHFMNNLF